MLYQTDLVDGARAAQSSSFFWETYNMVHTSSWGFPTLFAFCVFLLLLLIIKNKSAVAMWLMFLAQLPRNGFKLLKGWWGARRMNKDQVAQQRCELKGVLMDHIDTAVEDGRMTVPQANDHYRFFKGLFPDFKNCIEKVTGNAQIKAELAGSKDEHGNIMPMPFPDGEVPAKA